MNAAPRALSPIQHRKENTTPPTWWILLKIPQRDVFKPTEDTTPPTWRILLKIPSRDVFKPTEDTTPPTWWILLKIPQRKGFLAKSTTGRSEPAWCHPHSAPRILGFFPFHWPRHKKIPT
jgi:hypothetical protein